MTLLLDTQAWVWAINEHENLSSPAKRAIDASSRRHVSVVSILEIAQKVRIGKWPGMADTLDDLLSIAATHGSHLIDVTGQVALLAGRMPWSHRDPFDRLIAATAQVMGLTLVSSDRTFDSVPGGLHRLW